MARESQRLIGNAMWNVLGRCAGMAAGLILPPLAVHSIGRGEYGLVVLIAAVMEVAVMAQVGTPHALMRFMAPAGRDGDTETLGRFFNTGLAILCAAAVVVIGVTLVATVDPRLMLRLPKDMTAADTRPVVLALGLSSALTLVLSIGQTCFFVKEDFRRLSGIRVVNVTMRIAIVAGTLLAVPGSVFAYAAAQGISVTLETLLIFVLGLRMLDGVRVRWAQVRRDVARQILHYGGQIFLNGMLYAVYLQGGLFVLAWLTSSSVVAGFGLAMTWAMISRRVLKLGLATLIPAAANKDVERDAEALRTLLVRIAKLTLLIALPVTVFLCVFRFMLFETWMGPGYHDAAQAMALLLCAECLAVAQSGNTNMFVGLGDVAYFLKLNLFFAPLSLVLAYICIAIFDLGAPGLALSYLIVTVTRIGFLEPAYMARKLAIAPLRYFRQAYGAPLVAALLAVPVAYGLRALLPAAGWFPLIGGAFLFGLVYLALAYTVGMDTYDRGVVRSVARSLIAAVQRAGPARS